MKIILFEICSIVVLLVLFSACSTPAPNTPVPAVEPDSTLQKVPQPGRESEWENMVSLAKKEGKVVVYSAGIGMDPRVALISGMKKTYGIDAEILLGRGEEISQKLLTERRAGIYMVDVYIGGNTTGINLLKPAGIQQSLENHLILPEAKDSTYWYGEKLRWVDKDKTILSFLAYPLPTLAINSELVKEGEIKSLKDLLLPKYKGKIVINDPTISGSGLKWFGVMVTKLGTDYMKELALQEPLIQRDQRLQIDWLAKGRSMVAIAPQSPIMAEYLRAGAPLKFVTPVEGTYLTSGAGNVSLIDRSPRMNAARTFINWLLTREGQLTFTRAEGSQSARVDLPVDFLDPEKVRKQGIDYFNSEEEAFLLQQPKQAELAREIFGSLTR